MELKYIIDERGNFAIFSKLATHNSVARGFDTHNKIVGAGFCRLENLVLSHENGTKEAWVGVHCYGESISLDIKSRTEDSEIISEKLNREEY